jgi:peptide/nickel transport system substrate-binding protein
VKNDPKLRLVTSHALGYQGMTINLANGPRSDNPLGRNALVRQAFEAAVDRKALIQVVYNGMFNPTIQGIPPDSPMYDPIPVPDRDLAKAKALLAQAGVTLPVKITLMTTNTSDIQQTAEVLQSMVDEAGFDLQINTMETAASLQAEARGDYEAFLVMWSGRPDPDGNLYSFLHTGAGQNTGHYSNPIVDQALDGARLVTDVAQRQKIYAGMVDQTRKDMPIVYLYNPVNIVGMTKKLTGFRAVPDGMIRLQGLAFAP